MGINFSLKQFVPFIVFLVAYVVGYYAARCGVNDLCPGSAQLNQYVFTIFKPLWVFSLFALGGAIFLPFVTNKVFGVWLKFAVLWLALTIFLVATAPEAMNAWFYIFDTTKSSTAEFMGGAFTLITVALLPIATLAFYSRSKGYR